MERKNPLFSEFVAKHQKTWICQECGKVFINKTVFKNHVRENHPNVVIEGNNRKYPKYKKRCQTLLCNECGKSFTKKELLSNHIFRKHQNKTFDCQECSKQFRNRTYLN